MLPITNQRRFAAVCHTAVAAAAVPGLAVAIPALLSSMVSSTPSSSSSSSSISLPTTRGDPGGKKQRLKADRRHAKSDRMTRVMKDGKNPIRISDIDQMAKWRFVLEGLSFPELEDFLRNCWGQDNESDQFISVLNECHNWKQRNSLPDPTHDYAVMFANLCIRSKEAAEKLGAGQATFNYHVPIWQPMTRCVESLCYKSDVGLDEIIKCADLRSSGITKDLRKGQIEELTPRQILGGKHEVGEVIKNIAQCRKNEDGKNIFMDTVVDCANREVIEEEFPPAIRNFAEMILDYCRVSVTPKSAAEVLTYQNKILAVSPDWRAMSDCLALACRSPSTPGALAECATQDTSDAWWSPARSAQRRPNTPPPQYGENDLADISMGVENSTYSALLDGLQSCMRNEQQHQPQLAGKMWQQLIPRIDNWYAIERTTSRQNAVHKFALLLNKYCRGTMRSNPFALPEDFAVQYENRSLAKEPDWNAIAGCLPWASYTPDYERFAFCASREKSSMYRKFHPEWYLPATPPSLNSSNQFNITAADLRSSSDANGSNFFWQGGVFAVAGTLAGCAVGLLLRGILREEQRRKQITHKPLYKDVPHEER